MTNIESLIQEIARDVKDFDEKDRKSKKSILAAFSAKADEEEKENEDIVARTERKVDNFYSKGTFIVILTTIAFAILVCILKLPLLIWLPGVLFIGAVSICILHFGNKRIVANNLKEENESYIYRIICMLFCQYATENINKSMYKDCYKRIWEAYENLQKEGKSEDFEKAIKEVGLREMLENLEQ